MQAFESGGGEPGGLGGLARLEGLAAAGSRQHEATARCGRGHCEVWTRRARSRLRAERCCYEGTAPTTGGPAAMLLRGNCAHDGRPGSEAATREPRHDCAAG